MIDTALFRRLFGRLSLLVCSLHLFPAEVLGQQVVRAPILLAIHEGLKSKLDSRDIDQLELSLSNDGILRGTTGRVVAAVCRPLMSSFVQFWSDDDLDQYAKLQSNLSGTTRDRLAIIRAGNKRLLALAKYGKATIVTEENPWSFYASDPEIVSLVKAAVLRKAGIATSTSAFSDLRRTMLPVVIILLPTPGLFGEDDSLSESSVVTSVLTNTTNGWTTGGVINALSTTRNNRYIVLANESNVALPWMDRSLFTFTISHEVGHYLGLPHTFVDLERDLNYQQGPASDSALVRNAATRIRDTANCAKTEQYLQGKIHDVDYGQQRLGDSQRIGDTVPVVSGRTDITTRCLTAYASEVQAGMLHPKTSLMGRVPVDFQKPRNYERQGPDLKISADQILVVARTIKDMRAQPVPFNLCGN